MGLWRPSPGDHPRAWVVLTVHCAFCWGGGEVVPPSFCPGFLGAAGVVPAALHLPATGSMSPGPLCSICRRLPSPTLHPPGGAALLPPKTSFSSHDFVPWVLVFPVALQRHCPLREGTGVRHSST